MDPKACLIRAFDALVAGDSKEARQALLEYAQWRMKGGFEPTLGWQIKTVGDSYHFDLCVMWELHFRENINMPSF